MKHMKQSTGIIAIAMVFAIGGTTLGHGDPINVLLAPDNQLLIDPHFETGELNLIAGTLITTELPGIQVSSPDNGVPDGTPLGLSVTQGLIYWDGASVIPTAATVQIDSPVDDAFGNPNNSPVVSYLVDHQTGLQTGMLWGTYRSNPAGWHAHGSYSLLPVTAGPGLYGLVLQITSPQHVATDPFLLPLEYDPLEQWGPEEIELGVCALQATLERPGDLDGDTDTDFDDIAPFVLALNDPQQYTVDFAVCDEVLRARGDLDNDNDVDFDDIAPFVGLLGGGEWLGAPAEHVTQAATAALPPPALVPEPPSVGLLVAGLVGLTVSATWRRRAFQASK
jgi:hypothetical protein